MATRLLYLAAFFLFRLPLSFSEGDASSMESVPDLQKQMYTVLEGYPCVRLLNLSGEIGCANPGRDKVVAPIVRFSNSTRLTWPSAVVLSVDEMEGFFKRVSNDLDFAQNVGGVLVESVSSSQKILGLSPDQKFPQAKFSPYQNISYEWNPLGAGIMWNSYQFPVFLLSVSSSLSVQKLSASNEKREKAYTAHVAEFDLVMQTTKSGTRDSQSCIEEQTCLPLGGYSVWSSLPPMNASQSDQSKGVILAVASMDSASFFRDKSLGAESSVSGLIALLVAVDALSHVDGLANSSRQLVFLFLTGEAWGYLGSRRFLHELDLHSDSVSGLNETSIEMVLEVGSVGKGLNQGAKKFYAHTARASSVINETLNALKQAGDSLDSNQITISPASTANPGIPPSSLMAFLRKNSQTPGVILEDFDTAFTNNFYHSHLDDLSNINASSVADAATIIARTLYVLASGKNLSNSALGTVNVNESLVQELMGCLLSCEPGLSCALVKSYISPSTACPSHYAGVLLGEPSSTPYPSDVDDTSRFLWNFLADKTSIWRQNVSSACSGNCTNEGEVCIKAETDKKGVCVISTTRYVPAYSTRLKFESGSWKVLPPNSSDPMGMADPVWTESNWDLIGLRAYTVQDSMYDHFVLLVGVSITVLAYVAIVTTRTFITKALKRD
ncbi:hypothetical protein EUGRSUZ_F02879 [Eucalyptus grandis]|uniref:Nicastrin n=2 Tax=Eucalyptus grandis TaxID=71139 RepID=A0A059BTV0_EUCGR|nr:hypothetical protein EUGRSUZ_F02879 [Eucalyptus grandis]